MATYRKPVNKSKSVQSFNKQHKRTKAINLKGAAARGGIRL